jgi:multidrug resistance efflux pump
LITSFLIKSHKILTPKRVKQAVIPIAILGCVFSFFPPVLKSFSSVQSIQAFVNSDVVSVRAPVAGKVILDNNQVSLGKQFFRETKIGQMESNVENPRVSVLKLRLKELGGTLHNIKVQLGGLEYQIKHRRHLLDEFQSQASKQQGLDYFRAQQVIDEQNNLLKKAISIESHAKVQADRYASLYKKGIIPKTELEERVATSEQSTSDVNAQQYKLKQLNADLKGYQMGIQLNGTRALSYAETRTIELNTEITDLSQQMNNLQVQEKSILSEINSIESEEKLQKKVPLITPSKGIIWSIDAQNGASVNTGDSILKLVNCDKIWIEAFIPEESNPKLLMTGRKVKVTLLTDHTIKTEGIIETVRAGSGRVQVGDLLVQPPPEILRRQLPVRVLTVRIALNNLTLLSPSQFCGAGLSARVNFSE